MVVYSHICKNIPKIENIFLFIKNLEPPPHPSPPSPPCCSSTRFGWTDFYYVSRSPLVVVVIEGRVQTQRSHSNARLVSHQAGSPSQSLREWIWPLNSVPHGLSKWHVSKCEALQWATRLAAQAAMGSAVAYVRRMTSRTLGNFGRAGVWQLFTSWRQFVRQSLRKNRLKFCWFKITLRLTNWRRLRWRI